MTNLKIELDSQVFQILSATANSSRDVAARRAMELLDEMKGQQGINHLARPDAATYAYLINTITKSKVKNSLDVATYLLREVEEGYEAGDDGLKPSRLFYSAVLQCYAKSASPQGAALAEDLFRRTQHLYETKGKVYAKPTTLYYNALMDAHARIPCRQVSDPDPPDMRSLPLPP